MGGHKKRNDDDDDVTAALFRSGGGGGGSGNDMDKPKCKCNKARDNAMVNSGVNIVLWLE